MLHGRGGRGRSVREEALRFFFCRPQGGFRFDPWSVVSVRCVSVWCVCGVCVLVHCISLSHLSADVQAYPLLNMDIHMGRVRTVSVPEYIL